MNRIEAIGMTGCAVEVCQECDGIIVPEDLDGQTLAHWVLKEADRAWECECNYVS